MTRVEEWFQALIYSPRGRLGRAVRRAIRPWIRPVYLIRLRLGFEPQPLTIVSAADSSHFESLQQLIRSLLRFEFRSRVLVIDLGLTTLQRNQLGERFPSLEVRTFDYASFPPHFNIRVKAGEYAWKPVIVAGILEECRGLVLWLDAGCVVTDPLLHIRWFLRRFGFYSPASTGTIGRWTHPDTLARFEVPPVLLQRRQRSASVVGVSFAHPEARSLVQRWKECALRRDCIAPPGSDRANHRQDQAILSLLVEQSGLQASLTPEWFGVAAHRDIDRVGTGPPSVQP